MSGRSPAQDPDYGPKSHTATPAKRSAARRLLPDGEPSSLACAGVLGHILRYFLVLPTHALIEVMRDGSLQEATEQQYNYVRTAASPSLVAAVIAAVVLPPPPLQV